MKPISLLLPDFYIQKLDDLVRENFFPSRSEAIRMAIHDLLQQQGKLIINKRS